MIEIEEHPIFQEFPDKENVDKLLSQDFCEIDYEFPGFMSVYEGLSKIIPLNYSIIDFGCYMAVQSGYFKKHKSYIGVDIIEFNRFQTYNSKHYVMTIKEYIDNLVLDSFDEVFAICSYVPDYKSCELVRTTFKNVFCFYPAKS